MKNFKFINNVAGWISFAVAAVVYLLTIEPTASFWDCGEFIATSYKMEVGHPPGNSIFMLIARFFTLFASSPEHAAILVNAMSALCSAFCILFLFWSITHLARRIYASDNQPLSLNETIAIMGAGFVGAFAYMFSDTFWFSAVEGEVYAMSSLFTAFVFWAILKWEEEADKKHANRWLILLAYLMGISIGVHQLNLLALPSIIFVYYFKKYPISKKGIIITSLISLVILFFTVFLIIPGLPQVGGVFDLFFVNTLHLSYNSGLTFFAFFILIFLALGVYNTHTPKRIITYALYICLAVFLFMLIYGMVTSALPAAFIVLLIVAGGAATYFIAKYRVLANTVLLCLAMFVLGYFSLAAIVIRSSADTPINENTPDNAFSLLRYVNREQYGSRPLFTGNSFMLVPTYDSKGEPEAYYNTVYSKNSIKSKDGKITDNYKSTEMLAGYHLNSEYKMFLPRLFSREPSHIEEYAKWADIAIPRGKDGRYVTDPNWKGPSATENMKFMFRYQFNWMYWRYFMWNFVGRQNDVQGHGSSFQGNWVSGITPIDDLFRGTKSAEMPDYFKDNKGHNRYFFLPFLLGIFGLVFQFVRDKRNFTVVILLFIMTGIAIAFYLNMPPLQPRERDYVFAGSFYAFAIWIGFGVLAAYEFFRKYIKKPIAAPAVATALCMVVPVIMGAQNWDDHDRSNRYIARDFARNYLQWCDKNAILYCFGDNDTFPLWYLQETEEQRTDMRVMNVSLLGGSWYIDQMKKKAYNSEPVPFSLPYDQYQDGINDLVWIKDITKEALTAKQIISFVTNPNVKKIDGDSYIPTRTIAVPVDKKAALANGIVAAKDTSDLVDTMYLKIDKNAIGKAELMTIDLLANYKWDRPIYFTSPNNSDIGLGLTNYMQLEGFVYKIVPLRHTNNDIYTERIDTDILYNNLMNNYCWGNMDKPNVLVDYHCMFNIAIATNVREKFAFLAHALIDEGKTDKAVATLDRCMELMPRNPYFYNMCVYQNDQSVLDVIKGYYRANETEKANRLFDEFTEDVNKCLRFFIKLKGDDGMREIQLNMIYVQQLLLIAGQFGEKERATKLEESITSYYSLIKAMQ